MAILFSAVFVFSFIIQAGGVECPDEWSAFQGSCYIFIDDLVAWTEAWTICQTLEAPLVEIETPEENEYVAAQIRARHENNEGIWLGLQDFLHEGVWVWSSNLEQAEYQNWEPGEPNNDAGGQDCATMHASGRWDDDFCDKTHSHYVACERSKRSHVVHGMRISCEN